MKNFIYDTLMDSYRSIIRINAQTMQVYPAKCLGQVCPASQEALGIKDFIQLILQQISICPDDFWVFDLLGNPSKLIDHFEKGQEEVMLIYRQIIDQEMLWIRINLIIPKDFPAGKQDVLLLSYEMNKAEKNFYDSYASLDKRYHRILKVNLTQNTYRSVREAPSEKIWHQRFHTNSFSSECQYIADHLVHADYKNDFLARIQPDMIRQHFAQGNSDFTYIFRRRIGTFYRWVQLIILPTMENTPDNEVYHFFLEDIHKSMLHILDTNAALAYSKFYTENHGKLGGMTLSYYENLLVVLHDLTDKFLDYYMVDLEKDLYIQYKPTSRLLQKAIPFIGNYSQSSRDYILKHASPEERDLLLAFCTSDRLRQQLMDRMTLEYEFTSDQGQRVKTTCRKLESVRGIPTKVICYTTRCEDQAHLLKIKTFGNFEVFLPDGSPLRFTRKQSRHLLAYLVDKHGYPVTSKDIVIDLLEKSTDDKNAIKYVSTVIRRAINDLEAAGFPNVIIKEQKTVRLNVAAVDCDYFHVLDGDHLYWQNYHNEYMKEYSWAEATNAELLLYAER